MKNVYGTHWDVVVVGGGAAGMMAAGRAAELGARVIVIEKNATLGKKLLITGGGRCNVTNAEFNNRALSSHFQEDGKFLLSAFSKFAVKNTLEFFHTRHMPTHVEDERRVFPTTNRAASVWKVLVDYLHAGKVTILSDAPVMALVHENSFITGVRLANGKLIEGKEYIIATGGNSRPETGSSGDGFVWMRDIGHTVFDTHPALAPLMIKDMWPRSLHGLTLPHITLTSYLNGKKQKKKTGSLLFTHVGISGPTALNMSSDIAELLKYGIVTLTLDLLPDITIEALSEQIEQILISQRSKKMKNCLSTILPSRLVSIVLELSGVDPELVAHHVTRARRITLIRTVKALPMRVKKLLGTDKAISTGGGVALTEVDFKTMRSRLFQNLYLVGDILNMNRPSGGYSLQVCWTTGYIAGSECGKKPASTIRSASE